jgi:hypothetical protein
MCKGRNMKSDCLISLTMNLFSKMEVKMRLTAMKPRYTFFYFFSYCFKTNSHQHSVSSNAATVLIVNLLEMHLHQI